MLFVFKYSILQTVFVKSFPRFLPMLLNGFTHHQSTRMGSGLNA